MNDNDNISVVELASRVEPGPLDDDDKICRLVADWGYRLGQPNLDQVWVIENGAYFPINNPECFICWLVNPIQIAVENDELLLIDDSVRMFLLAIIGHKEVEFPDELYFNSAAMLLDWIIAKSEHRIIGDS